MFTADLYQPIYLIVVTILTVITTSIYKGQTYTSINNRAGVNITGYLIALAFALFIGFRPVSGRYFVDMSHYREIYYALVYGRSFSFNWHTENYLYDNFLFWLGSRYYEITVLYVVLSLIYFLCAYKAVSRLFGKNALLAFAVFLGAFSTFSYATNGMKAGVAASLFLCALSYRNKPIWASAFLFLSLGFHHSMILPIGAYIAAYFVKNSKYYFIFWVFALVMAAAHISFLQEMFAGLADERGAEYLTDTEDWGGRSGFRIDFVLYSALPVAIGYLAIYKYKLQSKTYSFLLNTYLLTNAVWMVCMYAAFTNRIAYLSWLMYPVVTIYPFFCKTFMPEQTKRLKQVVWFQLLFTLFMDVIYYG